MRILIADDHAILRKGITGVLLSHYPGALIEEATDGDMLFKKIIGHDWDLIITDISMPPGRSGLDCLAQIRESLPKVPVLVLSMHPENQYATRALKAGAWGYINKNAPPGDLLKAVERVLQGRKYISPEVAEKLAEDLGSGNKALHELLSDREFEVMKLLASGKSVLGVAEQLFLSSSTISTYRSRILEKMNLETNADLTRYALDNGLI
jgi:two-component system, NarL family, invasion response regulator UvrY